MKKQFELSAYLNNATYNDFLWRIKKLAISRFKWENIPKSWNKDFLEDTLYYDGMCGAFYDDKYGDIISKITINGNLNIYNMPIKCNCYSIDNFSTRNVYYGFKNNQDDKKLMVLIKNNADMRPTFNTIQLFCMRLYETERATDVNLNQQKTPSILTCDPKQRLTLLNLYQQYKGNQPFIFADKNLLDINSMRTIDTSAPFLLDKLDAHKQSVFNDLLTFLGINNVNFEKKERLISNEANANNQVTDLNIESELECRQLACEQINDYFGLNVSVKLNPKLIRDNDNVDNFDKNVESGDTNE